MNSTFERKNELGKKAKEMIEKYELDVDTMPEEVQEIVNLHMKVEKWYKTLKLQIFRHFYIH